MKRRQFLLNSIVTSGGIALAANPLAAVAEVPNEIKFGILYSGSGPFTQLGLTSYMGFKIWIDDMNKKGGVFVKPYGKKLPAKLIAYDDQSNPSTATILYNKLLTDDKVDIFIADGGSVMTAPAVPIAQAHHVLLINQTATAQSYYSPSNKYIVGVGAPVSGAFGRSIIEFMAKEAPKLGIHRIAMLFSTNEFTGTQAKLIKASLDDAMKNGAKIEIVLYEGVPTTTQSYVGLINKIASSEPDAVIELGYPTNDISFLRDLKSSGVHFKFLFALYPGIEFDELVKSVGTDALKYVFTLLAPNYAKLKVNAGDTEVEFHQAWDRTYQNTKVNYGYNSIAGYNTGVVLEKMLETTKSLKAGDLRSAAFALSGKLETLAGTFRLDENGAQIGNVQPLAQLIPASTGGLKFAVVYPEDVAVQKPLYPMPVD